MLWVLVVYLGIIQLVWSGDEDIDDLGDLHSYRGY